MTNDEMARVVSWFSCGAASVVATKLVFKNGSTWKFIVKDENSRG